MNVLTAIYSFSDGCLTVKLNGEIDHHSARDVRGEIDRQILFYKPDVVILDLAQIGFMDSSGLGLIMGRYNRIIELGGILKIGNPRGNAQRMMKMSGADKLIPIVFTEGEGDRSREI